MKLCIKRIYCDSCQKLVRCCEQGVSSETKILCSKCGRLLYFWDGVTLRYTQKRAPAKGAA